ncbi:hypothetical protein [Intrasporangium sp.]|uniref:hypothetical protein n=1 Tax=Intrasporangium sp. TaxID=1925024 RepID=UPI0029396462|nr:hypothetical protein [Intrasporangium sp.]MDV3220318.1 hypothetical protein [Intrasporangium sp.]
MSEPSSYSFLPWLRQGLAGQISSPDGDPTVTARASVGVNLTITGQAASGSPLTPSPVSRNVQLFGPGDVVGIDPRAIVRTDPRDWITNAEPNYVAHIEFYDEDLPWRYTPAAPSGDGLRLRPWIALVVLEETEEFRDATTSGKQPLPAIDVLDPGALPPTEELWAWAHVHVNASLSPADGRLVDGDAAGVAARLAASVGSNHDIAYSRLICPRRLTPNTRYHAFVVPTFETGRLAGLGLDPAGAPHATVSAWAAYSGKPAASLLPYYHRWYFRTGDQGDFEYLVRLLEPRPLDARVGVRDVDLRHPGSGLRGVTDPALGGILKLGGALRVPDEALTEDEAATRHRFEEWDQSPPAAAPYPQPFQADMAAFVNLPDDYAVQAADAANGASGIDPTGSPDPLITAPLYGRWHALTQRLLVDRDGNPAHPDDNWVHELNLDPRHRLAAGFGTRVVQANQERYMDAAWGQIGDVLEANRRIRLAQLARLVSQSWWSAQLTPSVTTRPERVLRLTAPAHRHVLLPDAKVTTATPYQSAPGVTAPSSGAATLSHRFATSLAGPTLLSAPLRRATRPGARLARQLPFGGGVTLDTLLERVDSGEVSPAPPKVTPPGVVTTDDVADTVDVALPSWVPGGIAGWLLDLLRRWRALPWLVLTLAVVLVIAGALLWVAGGAGSVAGAGIVLVGLLLVALWQALRRSESALDRADSVRPGGLTEEHVDRLPDAPGFELIQPGEAPPTSSPGSSGDSPTAARLKDALRDWARLYGASERVGVAAVPAQFGPTGLASLATGTAAAVEPAVTIPKRVLAGISLPPRIATEMVEDFGEVMAYPRIDSPMYEPLRDLSDEYLLPNLNRIPPNTISLLETNQPFIEAYLVGLNHEMARELLWREYPTDQRGTPFRQFWDVSGARPQPGLTPEQATESLLDIPELHRWPKASRLGEHDHRETPGETESEAVLVIRGELLKKYPTAIIYAHRARWEPLDGRAHPENERRLVDLQPGQEADPPDDIVKTPLYEARVHPDITFFGFDLTVAEAMGGDGSDPDDDAGWFFCIKERPGEPRFGFDIEPESSDPPETVNDIAWPTIGTAEGSFLAASALSPFTLDPSVEPDDAEKLEQRSDDLAVLAAAPTSAARWAYLTYQSPVLVAVHAVEMLRREDE